MSDVFDTLEAPAKTDIFDDLTAIPTGTADRLTRLQSEQSELRASNTPDLGPALVDAATTAKKFANSHVSLGRDTTPQETAGLGPVAKSLIGVGESAKHFTESLSNPINAALLIGGGALAKTYPIISRALSGVFGAAMTKQAAEEAGDLAGMPKGQRDAKTVAKHLANIALTGGTAALASYDAALAEHPAVKQPEIGTTRSTSFPPSKARPVEGTPSTIKEAAPVIPETKPQTEGEQNASAIPIPASVPQPEVRTPVGQKTPLRQQGEVAGTQGPPGREEPLRPPGSGPPQGELTPPVPKGGAPVPNAAPVPDKPKGLEVIPKGGYWQVVNHDTGQIEANFGSKELADEHLKMLQSPLPQEAEQAPVTPQDLTPALKLKNGDVIRGEQGVKHNDIIMSEAAKGNAEVVNEPEHGFVDKQGNFFSRRQASDAIGEKDDLHSERLAELQKPAVKPENVTTSDASSKPSAAEGKGKKLPNPYLKDAESSFEHDIIGRMESEGRKINASTLKGVGKDFAQRIRDIRKLSSARKIIGTSGGQSLDEIADDMGFESTDELLDAIEGAHKQRQTMREQARQRYAADIAHAEASKTPALELAKPESVEEAKTRVAAEEKAAKEKDAKQGMLDKAAAPLSGGTGDLGQGDLLGGGDLFSNPKHSMGGATEADPAFSGGGDFVSNMFAAIDRDRKAMGKPPMPETQRRTWDEDNQRALAQMRRDPTWIPSLIADVAKNPRPLLSWEQAGMVWERNRLKAEAHNAAIRLNTAFEDGRQSDMVEAKQDLARYEDEILSLDDVVGRNGTGSEAGRSLQAQKMGAGDDFSLIEMRLEMRAKDNAGKPLTEQQNSEVQKAYDALKEAERKTAMAEDLNRRMRAQKAVDDLTLKAAQEAAKNPPVPPHIKVIADKLKRYFDDRAEKALKELQGTAWDITGALPKLIDLGASKIASGVIEFGQWSAEMIAHFPEKAERLRPYLQQIYDAALKLRDEQLDKMVKGHGDKEKVKKAPAKDPASKIAGTTASIKKTYEAGKLDEISGKVQTLARHFITSGIKEREPLVDAVHGVLTQIDPSITRSDTMDAMSGYGKYRNLSKDEISAVQRDINGQLQQIRKLEDMVDGKAPRATGFERRIPSKEESELIKRVNEMKKRGGFKSVDEEKELKTALATFRKRTENRAAEYQRKLDTGEFTTKPRTPLKLGPDEARLKADEERIKLAWKRGRAKAELAARSKWEKAFDQVAGTAKASALSGYHTLGKLLAYSAAKLAQKPVAEAIGAVASKLPVLRDISKGAKFESGTGDTVKALAKFYTGFARRGMREAAQQLKTGTTDTQALYGKQRLNPPRWYDFFGNLHAAEKTPLLTGTYELYLHRANEWAIRNGIDPSDEFVQGALRKEAFDYAHREILQENNQFATEVNGILARLEKTDKATGKVNAAKSALAAIFKTFVTKGIVRTPANYVMQSLEHSPAGLTFGLTKATAAWRNGVENLKPVENDAIMRLMKVGAIGSAMFIWGAIDATKPKKDRTFGGYYQPGENRGDDDVKFGTIRIPGIPNSRWTHLVTHNPATEAAQMGSTLMRVALSKLSKKNPEGKGAVAGMVAAVMGLAQEAPVSGEGLRLAKIGNPNEQGKVVGDLVKGLIPQLVQNIAEDTDKSDDYRPPKTALQDVKLGIPGLRETVPVKKVK